MTLHTTILGDCDLCPARNVDVSACVRDRVEVFACDECRGITARRVGFAPVTTLVDLETLDQAEIVEGYLSAKRGDPEPGENRGRAFWHGWRCRQMDYGEISIDAGHSQLVAQVVEANRQRAEGGSP